MTKPNAWSPGTTHWSQHLDPQAGNRDSWSFFYETYKDAVSALYRHSGVTADGVEDLVHEFFTSSLQSQFLSKADPDRGRFRGYLCTAARRFLASERRKSGRQKRRPASLVSLDASSNEPAFVGSPQDAFDLQWARGVLARGVASARREASSEGRSKHATAFELRQAGTDWNTVAQALQVNVGAVRGWVARHERRVAECIRHEVMPTVGSQSELEQELKELSEILSRG